MTPEAREKIEGNREQLEELAASDLPCSDVAEALLDAANLEAKA